MLHYEAVSAELVDVLRLLMAVAPLQRFRLAGGTALALKHGHRTSVDIDLFTDTSFEQKELFLVLQDTLRDSHFTLIRETRLGMTLNVDDVKLDLVCWKDQFIDEVELIDSIRFFSDREILAMKLAAISERHARKDFVDLYLLLHSFSFEDAFLAYQQKHPFVDLYSVQSSIRYFERADKEVHPMMLNMDTSWQNIKQFIVARFDKFNQDRLDRKEEMTKARDQRIAELIAMRRQRDESE